MKLKKRFVCKECGCVSNSWLGKCPECNSWSSFIEEIIEEHKNKKEYNNNFIKPIKIQEVQTSINDSLKLNEENLNVFFGEGLIAGSIVLLAGEPGIGKSTFLFFLSNYIERNKKIYYFSGEESSTQIKKRFDRVGNNDSSIFVSNISDIDSIIEISKNDKPTFLFIDSIQTTFSSDVDSGPGTISQIKKCTQSLVEFAKSTGSIIFIVCHITKSGEIAGPKVMEHMVDVVTYFESDFKNQYRVLRSKKNRFGNVDEVLFFEMESTGLKLILNPSTFFIENESQNNFSGKCKTVIIEGKRPMIIEIEALVIPSSYPNPRRYSEGIDLSRLNRIVAIVDKHMNENLNNYDIYLNIAGGIKTSDVGIDLAIAVAVFSSKNKIEIPSSTVFIGELSLTGQAKKVYKIENRIKESQKFGYNNIYTAQEGNNKISSVNFIKEILL